MHAPRLPRLDRRSWLAGLACAVASPMALGDESKQAPEDEAEIRAVEAMAEKAGIDGVRVSRSPHYLGIGNAADAYRDEALKVCEAVVRDCLDHFRKKGFAVEVPARRGTVVILATADDFARMLGIDREAAVGGIYDVDTNRLTTFDFRRSADPGDRLAARRNTVALVHEAVHHWTYNSGLLDRRGDIPVCLSEGLAMYAEERPPTGRATPGEANQGRISGLRLALQQRAAWIPIADLLNDDELAAGGDDPTRQQLVYAENWLLVYSLMKNRERLAAFPEYLRTINGRRDATKRLGDFEAGFGDIEKFDAALKAEAKRLARR